MEPQYGNLGDHAIAYASECFIKDCFPEYQLIAVSEDETCQYLRGIKKSLSTDDLIFIQGGGNMGSLYPYIERMRRFCVKKLPEQKIICMPTSIFYGDDSKSKRELKKGVKIYNRHKHLIGYKPQVAQNVKDVFISRIGATVFYSTDNVIISMFKSSLLAGYLSN